MWINDDDDDVDNDDFIYSSLCCYLGVTSMHWNLLGHPGSFSCVWLIFAQGDLKYCT